MLDKFGIAYEMEVVSAHRTPARAHEYATTAASRGLKVLIAAAGVAAHLAGVIAANTTLPVIGVPMAAGRLEWTRRAACYGADARRNSRRHHGDRKSGGRQCGDFCRARFWVPPTRTIARKLVAHKEDLARAVTEKNQRLQEQLAAKHPIKV